MESNGLKETDLGKKNLDPEGLVYVRRLEWVCPKCEERLEGHARVSAELADASPDSGAFVDREIALFRQSVLEEAAKHGC